MHYHPSLAAALANARTIDLQTAAMRGGTRAQEAAAGRHGRNVHAAFAARLLPPTVRAAGDGQPQA
jgi:hypothetical protein